MREKAIGILSSWAKASFKHLYICPDRPELICYGTGYNEWGVQTNQKAFAALAVLASDDLYDGKAAGKTKEELLDITLKLLRFSLQSHIEGDYSCTDGTKWGHSWISALGTERMMHGIEAIYEYLSEDDKQLLEKVLISEADWLVDEYEVAAGEVDNNRPESNIWNGAILYRVSELYPNAPRRNEYLKKGTAFFLNGISVPEDKHSNEKIDGIPLCDWHKGANFFSSYSLNHHRYLNVGYMVICLSNIAMLHFFYKKRNAQPPKALYHHAKELWQLIKTCTYSDGRLIRIGGDTRVRYCYCQDYAIPMWIFVRDYLNDTDCDVFLKEWLKIVEKETKYNGDGMFLSDRVGELYEYSPTYYTRLESDRAVTLSYISYYFRNFCDITSNSEAIPCLKSWYDDYHGAFIKRSDKAVTTFTWRGAEGAVGLCLPLNDSSLAEWRHNMTGVIEGIGNIHHSHLLYKNDYSSDNFFVTLGAEAIEDEQFISEGQYRERIAVSQVAYASLPDSDAVLVMQYATANIRCFLKKLKGINLNIPNDIYNNNQRTYYYNNEKSVLNGNTEHEILYTNSDRVNIDDNLGIISVYGGNIIINRAEKRNIGIRLSATQDSSHKMGMLYTDEICSSLSMDIKSYDKNEILIDTGFIVQPNVDHETTLENNFRVFQKNAVRGIAFESYLLLANFSDKDENIEIHDFEKLVDLTDNNTINLKTGSISILAKTAKLYKI